MWSELETKPFFFLPAGILLWTFRILWWDSPGVGFISSPPPLWKKHYHTRSLFLTHSPVSPSVLTCTELLESLRCWIESSPSWEPQTTKSCSSVRWRHSWQSWKTTLPIAASSICVWMVRLSKTFWMWRVNLGFVVSLLFLLSCQLCLLRHYKGGRQRNATENVQRSRVRVFYFPAEHKSRRPRPQPAVRRHCGDFWLGLEPPSGEESPLK